jgi:hypothetical protein
MSTPAVDPVPGDGELSDAERKLLDAAVGGLLADLRPGKADGDDTAQGDSWDSSRQIRASLLADLLTGNLLPGGKHSRTVKLRGARITGILDLEAATLTCPVWLWDCYLDEPVILDQATAPAIRLNDCRLPGLIAQQLHTTGDVDLAGVTLTGDVVFTLSGARIGGSLNLSGAKLANAGGHALIADQITVGQSMVCRDGFTADGELRLTGARIGGQLDMTGAKLSNLSGRALTAESLTVEHEILCQDGFTADGEVSLSGAHIGGQLDMTGARLANPGGTALNAEDLTVEHSMFCKDGFTARGEISLTAARIGGNLSMSGARLANLNHRALNAEGLTVQRSMFCGSEFTAYGAIHLAVARINGELDLGDANLANPGGPALDLQAAQTARLILPLQQQPDGTVNLTNARAGEFYDEPATWPAALHIQGFTYDILGSKVSTRDRLDWLRRHQGGYVPQLYDQLATTYRRAGDEKAAHTVAIAKQRRRRRAYSPLSWLWYITVGYGYRTWLAGIWLLALVALGTRVFSGAYPAHIIAIRAHPPAFHAAAYALDLLLPVVGLGQKSAWQPQGEALLYWSWALTGAGWLLTSAVAAGLTGILKRD